jgi:hypothetical protein
VKILLFSRTVTSVHQVRLKERAVKSGSSIHGLVEEG